ncbi:MAG: phytanoyl-CoA dioxygenase family protein [Flavobacteriaceae bacterium]
MKSNNKKRHGSNFSLTKKEISQFNTQGYLVLKNVLTEKEMLNIDPVFDHFISGKEQKRMKKDFCDMSQPYGTPFEKFQLVNAMLPGKYMPSFKENIFFKVAQNISKQLYPSGIPDMDYEQFLAKKPTKKEAEFSMHQDLGYWPKTKNTWTATFSLALSDADIVNGCLNVIPGSNNEKNLREHKPKSYSESEKNSNEKRDDSHTLVIESNPNDKLVYLPVKRGDITIHDERIVHGSGGNNSDKWRKTYIIAFRDSETIKKERSIGFTHSHNDKVDWEKIISI